MAGLHEQWHTRVDGAVTGISFAGTNGFVAVTDQGRVYRFAADGGIEWSVKSPLTEWLEPVADTNAVYLCSAKGTVRALDDTTGRERWNVDLDGRFMVSPLALMMTNRPVLIVMGRPKGTLKAMDRSDGSLLWMRETGVRCDAPLAASSNVLAFGNCDSVLNLVDANGGVVQHSVELGERGEVAGAATFGDGCVYLGTYKGDVVCVDLNAYNIKWRTYVAEEAFLTPVVKGSRVVAGSSTEGILACLDHETGKTRWRVVCDPPVTQPVLADEWLVITSDGELQVRSWVDGRLLDRKRVSDYTTAVKVRDQRVFMGTDDGFVWCFLL